MILLLLLLLLLLLFLQQQQLILLVLLLLLLLLLKKQNQHWSVVSGHLPLVFTGFTRTLYEPRELLPRTSSATLDCRAKRLGRSVRWGETAVSTPKSVRPKYY